ncbi:uncharacterized protein LOC128232894 [Mya arenaria]|nr:uncharacterized protein LOC128232894 [Mya arenaria]XP_052802649.1 uncharacterized protein LOC128232894 [Mya arenaria]
MGERYHRYPRHPIAKRPPVEAPPRIEMNVRRGYYDQVRDDFVNHDDGVVCTCYPRTSQHTVPSMFYDKIQCPHKDHAHIQPAHNNQFNYPWTANSIGRKRDGEDDDLSERLSLISEEDDQLRFSPNPFPARNLDQLSIRTAPPLIAQPDYESEVKPPYTAPVNDTQTLLHGRRAQSMQDIRDPAYRSDGLPHSRNNASLTQSRLSNRQFTGTYVDPRNGKAYNYNVNYEGGSRAQASRNPAPRPSPARKPMTAS